jgi:hypothetical protein
VRSPSRSPPILSNPPLTSIADTGRRPEALEYDEGAEVDGLAGNTNDGRGNGPLFDRGEGISEEDGDGWPVESAVIGRRSSGLGTKDMVSFSPGLVVAMFAKPAQRPVSNLQLGRWHEGSPMRENVILLRR